MPTPKPTFIDFAQIIENIDLNAIVEAIRTKDEGEKDLDDWAFEDCKRLIWAAGEKWLPRDLHVFKLEGTEVEGFIEIPGLSRKFHGFGDIVGVIKGGIEPFTSYAGAKYCVDWKTSKSGLDTKWRERLIDSWQWQDYAVMFDAALVLYRGLSRNGDLAEIILKVHETNYEEVCRCGKGVGIQVDSLWDSDLTVWPLNKPHACHAFGRECPYLSDCKQYSMPQLSPPRKEYLSYSFINTFMLCNERARRGILEGDKEGSDSTDFGGATHRGLASLWQQAYKIYG